MKINALALIACLSIAVPSNAHIDFGGEVVGEIDYQQPIIVSYPGLGPCDFAYDGKRFYIIHDDIVTKVKPAFVDKKLRGITPEQLLVFLDGGYLYVNQLDNGDFTLTSKGRLHGGILGLMIVMVAASAISKFVTSDAVAAAMLPQQRQALPVPQQVEKAKKVIIVNSTGSVAQLVQEAQQDEAKDLIETQIDEACLTLTPRIFPLPRPPVVRGFALPQKLSAPIPGAPKPPILGAPRKV